MGLWPFNNNKPVGSRVIIETWRRTDFEKSIWEELKEKCPPITNNDLEASNQRAVATAVMKSAWTYLVDDFNHIVELKNSRESELVGEKYQLLERLKKLENKLDEEKSSRKLTKKKVDHEWGLKIQEEKRGRKNDLIEAERVRHAEVSSLTEHYEDKLQTNYDNYSLNLRHKDKEISSLKSYHATEKARWERAYEDEVNAWKGKLQSMEKAYEDEKNAMISSFTTAAAEKEQLHAIEIGEREEEKRQLVENCKQAMSDLMNEARDRESRLTAAFKAKTDSLTRELHELNTALLARDDDAYLPPTLNGADLRKEPDEHLKAKFLELGQIVDDLVNIPWREDQTVWTEQALHNLGVAQNQRLLKKRILLDTIWTILHKNVCCSPFRLFGKEGRHLEEQWNEQCGQDAELDNGCYVWPKPGVETERWRFFTVKECRQALMRPVPSEFDPRARLKKGFRDSTAKLVSELESTLVEVVQWDDSYSEIIKHLAKRFSNVWLEFGMHRCRIVIFLEGSQLQSVEEKVQKAEDGSLELVLAPGLGRYGDFRGAGLDNFAIIGGCNGDSITLPQ